MKLPIRPLLPAILLIGLLTACGKPKDQALPFSQDNLEKLAQSIQQRERATDLSSAQGNTKLVISLYKGAIEEDLKYDFDKTFRRAYLLQLGPQPVLLLYPVLSAVINDPTLALQNGFISQRTFDLVSTGQKAGTPLTTDAEQFLSFVTECQTGHSGVCDSTELLKVLAANHVAGTTIPTATEDHFMKELKARDPRTVGYEHDISEHTKNLEYERLTKIYNTLDGKYGIFHMGINHWITKPDGSDLSTNGLIQAGPERKFVVNASQVAIAKRYAQLLDKENAALAE